ncbi:MAG: condensation domain-containing protein, partial [Deltaproteobacteria bacterium]
MELRTELHPNIEEQEEVFLAPLSFAQERLWLLDQLDPGDAAYNVPMQVRLRGRLDADALYRAFDEIVRRHEVLRTTLQFLDGTPMQVIHGAKPVARNIIDLSVLPREQAVATLNALRDRDGREPFDLATGPMLRTTLVQLAPDEHAL